MGRRKRKLESSITSPTITISLSFDEITSVEDGLSAIEKICATIRKTIRRQARKSDGLYAQSPAADEHPQEGSPA